MGGRPDGELAAAAGCKGSLEVKWAVGLGRRESSPCRGLERAFICLFVYFYFKRS